MNKKQKSMGGNVLGKLKRVTAFILAAILMFTSPLPGLSFPSQAAPNLQPVTLPMYGGGLTTAFRFMGGSTGTFDIEGIKNPELVGTPNPYRGDKDASGNSSISTTYGFSGYRVYIQNVNSPSTSTFAVGFKNNGGVNTDLTLGTDLQVKVYPNEDDSLVMVEYNLHNRDSSAKTIQLGTMADICLGGTFPWTGVSSANPADASKLFITNRGISMFNSVTQESFEFISNDPDEGLTTPAARWVGDKRERLKNIYTDIGEGGSVSNVDSAMSYSWLIPLKANETVTKKVAFRVNNPSYYVNSFGNYGNDTNSGTYTAPFKTLERAIKAIKDNPLNTKKVGVIYIQDQYEAASTIDIPEGFDITFSSTDFTRNGDLSSGVYTIKRRLDFISDPIFRTSSGRVHLKNLILDGNTSLTNPTDSTEPIVSASGGLVDLQGIVIQNVRMSHSDGKGAAIDITGNGNLEMINCQVLNNRVAGKGAVHFSGTGQFMMGGRVVIDGNKDDYGRNSNVYLEEGNHIQVIRNMVYAKVGITSAIQPGLSLEGAVTRPDQEVIVAVPKPGSPVDVPSPPFANAFYADQQNANQTGPYTAVGSKNLPGVPDNDKNIVLKRNSYLVSFQIGVTDGTPPILNPPVIAPLEFAPGDTVATQAAPKDIPGYKLVGTTILQGTGTTLLAGAEGENAGVITGTMPGQSVTVEYRYRIRKSMITFHLNGGTPDQPDTWEAVWEGRGGLPINKPMPTVSKTGYLFKGWSLKNSGAASPLIDSFPTLYPDDELDYYAVFAPDPDVTFRFIVKSTNEDESTVLRNVMQEVNADTTIDIRAGEIEGYRYFADTSRTDPANVGTLFHTGRFLGTMPNKDLTVYYHYIPEASKTYKLTVNYLSENGTKLADSTAASYGAEEPVTAAPVPAPPHYSYYTYRFDKGDVSENTEKGWVYGVKNRPDAAGSWSDHMPNQDVELTYIYKGNPDQASKFSITEKYMDVTDPAQPRLISSAVRNDIPVDEPVEGRYAKPYGYRQEMPFTIAPDDPGISSNLSFGTAEAAGRWSGAMPAGNVTVTYNNTRNLTPEDPSKPNWAMLTYQKSDHGVLQAISPDVTTADAGATFNTRILVSDKTAEGNAAAYTWKMLKEKHLVPEAAPENKYYTFEGWFIDKNGDGKVDAGDTFLGKGDGSDSEEANQTFFTGATKLIASFQETPGQWIDIYFDVSKGTYVSGSTVLHIQADKTWGDIQGSLPTYTAWPHYTETGWYNRNLLMYMAPDMLLENGQHYILYFSASAAEADQFPVQVDYSSASGIVFDTIEMGKQPVGSLVQASAKRVSGYRLDTVNTKIIPENYAFDGVNPEPIGSFNPVLPFWSFLGFMPGEPLALHYKYIVDESKTFNLTVQYVSEYGVTMKDALTENHKAEDAISISPPVITGYALSDFTFVKGKTDDTAADMVKPAQGEPNPANGYKWDSKMPNQDVLLVYKYKGDTGSRHKITETYLDTGAADPSLINLRTPVVQSDIVPGAPVQGLYQQPYGYSVTRPFAITSTSADPTGAGIVFGSSPWQNYWSGHMPVADVEITYNHARLAGMWKNITWQAGVHGTLSAEGASDDLKPAAEKAGAYTAEVLRNDGTAAGNAAAYTLGILRSKKLMPTPVPEAASLYRFTGWFVDGNHNGILDNGETLLPDSQNFSADVTLTASFEEKPGEWMDISFGARKATLNTGSPQSLHIPKNTTWGEIAGRLPGYTVWVNYADNGWHDENGTAMTPDMTLAEGKTYTIVGIPDPLSTFTYTVKYTNRDGSVVFKEIPDPVAHSIEDRVNAQKIDVPGYVWNKTESFTDPAAYQFSPEAGTVPIGVFNDGGGFTGTMPGQELTVYYRYDVKSAATPEAKPFDFTIRYESENGGTLARPKTARRNAEEAISESPAAVDHYDCIGFRFVKGDQAVGVSQPVQSRPDLNNGYAWNGKMPNQDVELIYLYKGKEDESSKFKLTENYMDVTDPSHPSLISSEVRNEIPVDRVENGHYIQPYGYDPKLPFAIRVETDGIETNLSFGTGEEAVRWSGAMPASDVTVTYYNTRKLSPDVHNWSSIIYQASGHGTLSAASQSVTTPDAGVTYTAQILVSDGTEAGKEAAYTWKTLKEKNLVPAAAPESRYYTFAGWYLDKDGNGKADAGDTFLGKGDESDTPEANRIFFTGETKLVASFVEIQEKWIDIHFNAKNSDLNAGEAHSLHVTGDTAWGGIKDRLPAYTIWENYKDDGWHDESGVLMTDGMELVNGKTYTIAGIPNPDKTFVYTMKYTNEDGSVVFKEVTDSVQHSIEATVTAQKIDVPGYVWSKEKSGTDPAAYQFDPAVGAVPIGVFNDEGAFTGTMPGHALTVNYRYEVKPAVTPEEKPFHFTIKYESENGGTLAQPKTVKRNAEEAITEMPVAVDHYDCDGFRFIKGDQVVGAGRPVQSQPDPAHGYAWNGKMPNQDVELIYLYKGKVDESSKFKITERYMDVTDPAHPSLISMEEKDGIPVDQVESGHYTQPYGYDPQLPFTIRVETDGIQTNLAFGTGTDEDKWSGAMPASDVTITYNNTRRQNPEVNNWAEITYQKTGHGLLQATSQSVTTPDLGETYTAQILVSDGTAAGKAAAYTWKKLKEKSLVPAAIPENHYYTFAGWYIDANGNGTADPGEKYLGKGDATDLAEANEIYFTGETKLVASFAEIPEQWIDISFNARNSVLNTGELHSLHVTGDTTWGGIKNRLPAYTIWENYRDDGWHDESGALMTDDKALVNGETYTIAGIPDPDKTFVYTTKYTNEDGSIVFKEVTDPVRHSIAYRVNAQKIDVPGYVWNKDESYTDPAAYPFDPAAGAVPVGAFNDGGEFTGTMPGQELTVYYRYDVKSAATPEAKPFDFTIRYESENGGTLARPKTARRNAEEAISESPAAVDHYDCIGFRFVKGDQAVGVSQPVQSRPDLNNGYAWNGKMPNQDVELIYLYKGKEDESSKFKLTENYMDVTDPAHPSLISSEVRNEIPVDQVENGHYIQPYGYDPKLPFAIRVETDGIETNLSFGTGEEAVRWSGAMPASDVTVTYYNTRKLSPDVHNWSSIIYQASGHGTLSAASQSVTTPDAGVTYTAQILVSDGTEAGKAAAYTWKTLKEKNLVPAAAPESRYYTFAGWYLDKDGNGKADAGDTFLGKGDESDTEEANQTFFTGETKLVASFVEIPEKWIDIHFNAKNSDLNAGEAHSLHVTGDTAWGGIKDRLPAYTIWENYKDDGWHDESGVLMTDGMELVNGKTYTIAGIPNPDKTFVYTMKYTNEDGSVVFKEVTDSVQHSIEATVTAQKIDVPGYVWSKEKSGTDPAAYRFDPAVGAVPIGVFNDEGAFTGTMPGHALTVYYRYEVKPETRPEEKPFHFTIRYESENGGILAQPKTVKRNAEEEIRETPVAVDHYDCDGFRFVKGDQAVGTAQPVKSRPEPAHGYAWNGEMPNQDVELIYLYKGKEDESSKFKLTENYMDVTDPAHPGLISSTVTSGIPVDHVEHGQYTQPYGYEPQLPFTIRVETVGIQTNLAFGTETDADKWNGAMPASDVTITYYNTRRLNPESNNWAAITYQKTGHGTLKARSESVTTPDAGATYTAQILISDGTAAGDAAAYTWRALKEKNLIPAAVPENPYYMFAGWYIDANGNGRVDDGEMRLGIGDDTDSEAADQIFFTGETKLTASFEEIPGQWIDISFEAENGSLESGSGSLHVQADKAWRDIEGGLPRFRAWEHFKADGWYGGGIKMTPDMALTGGQTYTFRFLPNPDEKFRYTVEYTDETGTIVFGQETDADTYPVTEPVSAALKNVAGYEWDKDHSGTSPAYYPFDPNVGPTPVGSFDGAGDFAGRMPGEDLTVSYRYKLKTDASYRFHVLYQTESGGNVHTPAAEETKKPGETIYAGPETIDGYNCTGFRFREGKAALSQDGALLEPVKGEPVKAEGYQWESRMPNQDVTLIYLYRGDESARYKLTERYVDDDAEEGLRDIVPPRVYGPYPADREVHGRYEQPYGYVKTGQSITLDKAWDGDLTVAFLPDPDTSDGWSGRMPPRNMEITYHNRRVTENWKEITWLPGPEHGHLAGSGEAAGEVSADVREAGGGSYKASILINDGFHEDQAYSLGDIRKKKLMPKPVADRYYRFTGWFADTNGNGILDGDETILTDGRTFNGQAVLTACFEEDPAQWIDIKFAGENAVLNEGQNRSLHTTIDKTWGEINGGLPSYTPFVNYIADGWYGEGETDKMTDDKRLVNGRTYTIVCYPDPEIFGTRVEKPEASAGLNGQGKGKITLYNTTEGFYQYILTDMDGTILMARPKRAEFQRVEFNGLNPGTRYEVYEAVRELPALAGGHIRGLGVEGKTISRAAEVLTPVLSDNWQVYYDEENADEARTRLVIRPADPDTEYALLDENGQAAEIPGAAAGGWASPSGDGSLSIGNLGYNVEYTVVARPKGRTEFTAESRQAEGSVLTTDPIGELTLNKYILETIQGQIVRAGGEEVGGNRYENAGKGESVTLYAEPYNEAGEPFLYWKTTIGLVDLQKDAAVREEITFPMPDSNLVMTAVYDHKPETASPSNVTLKDQVRGGNRQEIALDPGIIREREEELTKDKDRELMDKNHASVSYQVVYQKNGVKPQEARLVKESGAYDLNHESAFHAAWGLNVSLERYVNGRRVELKQTDTQAGGPLWTASASNASPSNAVLTAGLQTNEVQTAAMQAASGPEEPSLINAGAYRTYIQMGRDGVDMMDYQLFEINMDPDGNMTATPVSLERDPETSGGLFTFLARAGSRYVMVYNRAYYLSFTDELPFLEAPQYYHFKVRRGESPAAADYAEEYGNIPVPAGYLINKKSGAEYSYQGWSYSPIRLSLFDETRAIRKTTRLYAHYKDNEKEIAAMRKKLEESIEEAWKLSEDPFMKRKDSGDLKEEIREALKVLQREEPHMALESELAAAKETLMETLKHFKELIGKSHEQYEHIRSRRGGGGSGGGGGGGKGVIKDPFNATPTKNYVVGTNGNWRVVSTLPGQEKEMSFVLDGGMPLKSVWGRLRYPSGEEGLNGWYHFDLRGIMDTGWVRDEEGKWYYCYKENEGSFGKMATGWYKSQDGNWYYLEPSNGQLVTGWRQIGGVWYYFETVGLNAAAEKKKGESTGGDRRHPLGSMYYSEMTPDGYKVNENGAWNQ